jgi:hypothetical protein
MKYPFAYQIAQSAVIIFYLLMIAIAAPAQQVVSAKAGLVQFTEGKVFLGSDVPFSPKDFVQMQNGQILYTKQGRAEVLLTPDIYFRLDEYSSLRMEQNRLKDTQLALEQGAALIEVVQKARENPIKVRFPTGVVEIKSVGLYRLDVKAHEFRVYGGAALIAIGNIKATIRNGRMARLEGNFQPMEFDVNASDPLHEWAARRSFNLFLATAETRQQMHWKPISLGWLMNYDYRKSFYSKLFFDHQSNPLWMQQEEEAERRTRAAEEEKALRDALEKAGRDR